MARGERSELMALILVLTVIPASSALSWWVDRGQQQSDEALERLDPDEDPSALDQELDQPDGPAASGSPAAPGSTTP